MTKQSTYPVDNTLSTQRVDDANAALRGILRNAPQDLWLETIRRAQMDLHADLIHWMLHQPECDFAIAAYAFYHSDPIHHLTAPAPLPQHPTATQLFAQVLRNWDTGFYRDHLLELTAQDIDPRLIRRVEQKLLAWPRGALPFKIAAPFLDPSGGRPVALPRHHHPDQSRELWQIFKTLGLRVEDQSPGIAQQIVKACRALKRIALKPRP